MGHNSNLMIWLIEMIRSQLWAGILLLLIGKSIILHVRYSLPFPMHLQIEGRCCHLALTRANDWVTRAYVNTCGSVFESSEPIANDAVQFRDFTVDKDHMFPSSFLCNVLFTVYSAEDLNSFTWSKIFYPQAVLRDVLYEIDKCF